MLHLKKEKGLNLPTLPVVFYKFLLIVSCCFYSLQAQRFATLKQQFKFGGAEDNRAHTLLSDAQGNLFVASTVFAAGAQVSEHFGGADIWIAALDASGKITWERSLGGSYSDVPGAALLHNGSLHVVGASGSFLPREEAGDRQRNGDAFYVALNAVNGSIEKYQTFGGSESDFASVLAVTAGNNILWGGHSFSSLALSNHSGIGANIWMQYLDTTLQQGFTAGGNADEFPIGLFATNENQWMLIAQSPLTSSAGAACPTYKPWFMSFNDSLKARKSILPNTRFSGRLHHAIRNEDGTFCLVGSTNTIESNPDFWWLKIAQNGEILAEKTWGGNGTEVLNRIAQCKDGGWVISGWSTYYNLEDLNIKGGDDVRVLRLDPEGNLEWEKSIGGPGNERGMDVIEYMPGTFYVLADKQISDMSDNSTLWLIRLDEEECDVPELSPAWKVHGSSVFVGQYIQFSLGTEDRISCLWDFGDGTTSKESNPMKKYYRKGSFEVTLTLKGNGGCSKVMKIPEMIEVQ